MDGYFSKWNNRMIFWNFLLPSLLERDIQASVQFNILFSFSHHNMIHIDFHDLHHCIVWALSPSLTFTDRLYCTLNTSSPRAAFFWQIAFYLESECCKTCSFPSDDQKFSPGQLYCSNITFLAQF